MTRNVALDLVGEPRQACGFEFATLGIRPHPVQRALLLLADREVLFGGAAGGSKTTSLILAALQFVDVPGYSALLLRRTYPELAGADGLLERCDALLGPTAAEWHASELTWSFPSGATLRLGHCERDEDRHKFSGHAFTFVGVDELTGWATPRVYLFTAFSRTRRPAATGRLRACPHCGMTLDRVPLRARATSNPGGLGHAWVRKRWAIQLGDGDLPSSRRFLPSYLSDNPSLDRAAYAESLAELDPVERERLLHGDWSVTDGGTTFERRWFDTVRLRDVPLDDCEFIRFVDLAATKPTRGRDADFTAAALVAVTTARTNRAARGEWYIIGLDRVRDNPARVETWLRNLYGHDHALLQQFGLERTVGMRVELEGGSGGLFTVDQLARNRFAACDFAGRRPRGSKAERARPVAVAAEAGRVHLVEGAWNGAFLDECQMFPDGPHDDQVDAVSGAFAELGQRFALHLGAPIVVKAGTGTDGRALFGSVRPYGIAPTRFAGFGVVR